MMSARRLKVLVVDDSVFFREVTAKGLSTDPVLHVVGTARDPYEARDMIEISEPDVIVCDVEMPKMNGIEFIRKLLPQYPVPVIIVSSLQASVFDALQAGAVDFVAKPGQHTASGMESFLLELIRKVKLASKIRLGSASNAVSRPESVPLVPVQPLPKNTRSVIAIGASTGGTEALAKLLKDLPPHMPGIVIVQHIPPMFSALLAERLNQLSALNVKEARNGEKVEPGKVLLAPGHMHLRIKGTSGGYEIECFEGEKVNGHCPSVDLLFESAAKEAGKDGVGIILTGMGYDGAKGLMAMRRKGARTLGQDEASCVVYGMPKAAYEIGAVEKQLPLGSMARYLTQLFVK